MANQDIALMAHLMRRAGFGATRDELEARVAKGYEATVEELLHPEEQEPVSKLDLQRYHDRGLEAGDFSGYGRRRVDVLPAKHQTAPEEKMTLFWHQVFATGIAKVDHYDELMDQTDMFREMGMGNYRDLLLAVAKKPGDDLLAGQQREPQERGQ